MGLKAFAHQSGQPLMQRGGAVELAVVLHAAGMPAGTLMAWPPVGLGREELIPQLLQSMGLEHAIELESHRVGEQRRPANVINGTANGGILAAVACAACQE